MWSYEDFPPAIHDGTGADIDTPTGSLFYQFAIGSSTAEVRMLTSRGFARTAALGQSRQVVPDMPDTERGWSNIARC